VGPATVFVSGNDEAAKAEVKGLPHPADAVWVIDGATCNATTASGRAASQMAICGHGLSPLAVVFVPGIGLGCRVAEVTLNPGSATRHAASITCTQAAPTLTAGLNSRPTERLNPAGNLPHVDG
jgi:hypothetical protein